MVRVSRMLLPKKLYPCLKRNKEKKTQQATGPRKKRWNNAELCGDQLAFRVRIIFLNQLFFLPLAANHEYIKYERLIHLINVEKFITITYSVQNEEKTQHRKQSLALQQQKNTFINRKWGKAPYQENKKTLSLKMKQQKKCSLFQLQSKELASTKRKF